VLQILVTDAKETRYGYVTTIIRCSAVRLGLGPVYVYGILDAGLPGTLRVGAALRGVPVNSGAVCCVCCVCEGEAGVFVSRRRARGKLHTHTFLFVTAVVTVPMGTR